LNEIFAVPSSHRFAAFAGRHPGGSANLRYHRVSSSSKERAMFVVVFEVEPKQGREQDYLDLAAELRPEVETIDGFISVERFQSLAKPGRLVSISYWRDGDAVKRWREHNRHHLAQLSGRGQIFADYRITVAEVERQYGMFERAQAPQQLP
jgi:heme-degrading monooxygenase HmoA